MKLLKVKRKTRLEPRYHKKMGRILVPVTKIYYSLFNIIPIKTLYKYRKTYHGKVKDCKDCKLDKIDNEII